MLWKMFRAVNSGPSWWEDSWKGWEEKGGAGGSQEPRVACRVHSIMMLCPLWAVSVTRGWSGGVSQPLTRACCVDGAWASFLLGLLCG